MDDSDYNSSMEDTDDYVEPSNPTDPSWWWTENLPHLVWAGLTLLLFVASFSCNLISVVTVIRHRHLHSGYFLVHIFFSMFHVLLFLLLLLRRVQVLLVQFNLFESLEQYPTLASILDIIDDLSQCVLGLEMLLLSALTIDCYFTLLRKPKYQSCVRAFYVILCIIIFTGSLAVMGLIRFTDLIKTGHEIDDELWPHIIRTAVEIGMIIFSLFFLVIFSTINCVSQRHSTHQLQLSADVARRLDPRHSIVAGILLFVWLAERIINLSLELEAYEKKDDVRSDLEWSRYGLGIAVYVLASIFPISTVSVLGRLCCCCCRSGHVVLDGDDEEIKVKRDF